MHEGGSLVQPVVASRSIDRFGELVRQREGGESLSDGERDVLALVARGARTRAIAERAWGEREEVKDCLAQDPYGKLGATNRAAAVARAAALGLSTTSRDPA